MARTTIMGQNQEGAKVQGILRVYWSEHFQRFIARSWPKGNGGDTPARAKARADFSQAVKLIKQVSPEDAISAYRVTKHTRFVPRDALMKAAYGVLFEVTTTDGTTWMGLRVAQKEIQTLLSSIGNDNGAILLCDLGQWVELLPGAAGQVLTIDAGTGQPAWITPSGGGGGSTTQGGWAWPHLTGVASGGTAVATEGCAFTPYSDITVTALAADLDAVAAATYGAAIYTIDAAGIITSIVEVGSTVTAAATEHTTLELPLPAITLSAGSRYAAVVTRTDGGDTTPVACYGLASSTIPLWPQAPFIEGTAQQGDFCQLAKANPAVGDTFTIGNGAYCIGLRYRT